MASKKYLCIQRSESGGQCEPPSPNQMEEMYAKFNAWKEKFSKNIVDLGGKLGDGKVVSSTGAKDGPFVEAKEIVGGFMIIEAEDIDQAVEVAQQCPGVTMPGSMVEIREIRTS